MKLVLPARALGRRITLLATAFVLAVSSLTALVPFVLFKEASAVGTTTEIVTGNTSSAENSPGWMFNRDSSTATPYSFYGGNASVGGGSISVAPIAATPANKFVAEHFVQKPISELTHVSVDYKLGAATDPDHVYFNVYANYGGSSATKFYDCRYTHVASTGNTAAFSTLTFTMDDMYQVRTAAGSAACPDKPVDMGADATIRAYSFNLGDTTASDVGMSAYFDRAVLGATTGDTVYDFEPVPVDTSSTKFLDEKYVRENNSNDIAAQLVTPTTTDDVRFIVDGNDAAPIAGYWQRVVTASTEEWRLKTPLPAGEHTLAAEIKVNGMWRSVSDTSKVYSLDTPAVSYVTPGASDAAFRSSDNPVRIKAEDQFEQFNYARFVVDGQTHQVNRADCDLRSAGQYVLCDVDKATTWSGLPDGTYTPSVTVYTKANNRLDNLVGSTFVIDNTSPSLTSHAVSENPSDGNFTVTATAEDAESGIDSVNFYITAPRESDNVCTGNGDVLYQIRDTVSSGGEYNATFAVDDLNGAYCVTIVSRNKAMGNSDSTHAKVTFDTTAPTVTINDIASVTPGTVVTATGTLRGYTAFSVFLAGENRTADTTVDSDGNWSLTFDTAFFIPGSYDLVVGAADAVENSTTRTKTFTINTPVIVPVDPVDPGTGSGDGENEEEGEEGALGALDTTLTPLITNPSSAVLGTNTEGDDEDRATDSEVKGASNVADNLAAAIGANNTDGSALGLAWYWWLLIIAGGSTIIWGIVSAFRPPI
jgi:hypothetical protein